MANYHQVVEKLITDPRNTVKVACLKDDPEIILGYAIYNEFNLHWVFVKKSWREIGIAKNLVPSNVETVTHLTKVGLSILIQKYPRADFNPFNL